MSPATPTPLSRTISTSRAAVASAAATVTSAARRDAGQAVPQRVLDERLQQERRARSACSVPGATRRSTTADRRSASPRRRGRLVVSAISVVERRLGFASRASDARSSSPSLRQHPSGLHRIVLRQHRDVLQAVEQEVRLQPHPQRVELGLAQARRQLRLSRASAARRGARSRALNQGAQRRGASDRRPVEQLVPEQIARRHPAQRHRVRRAPVTASTSAPKRRRHQPRAVGHRHADERQHRADARPSPGGRAGSAARSTGSADARARPTADSTSATRRRPEQAGRRSSAPDRSRYCRAKAIVPTTVQTRQSRKRAHQHDPGYRLSRSRGRAVVAGLRRMMRR